MVHVPYTFFGYPIGQCCDAHDDGTSDCQTPYDQTNNQFWNCLYYMAPPANAALYIGILGLADILYRAVASLLGKINYESVQKWSCYCAPCGSVMCAHANPNPPLECSLC